MTPVRTIPDAVAQWPEPPGLRGATPLAVLTPYLLTDGSVEFLARTDVVPVGAIEASMVDDGSGAEEIVTPAVPTGRRVIESASGLFFT
jgi:hypothetical protein